MTWLLTWTWCSKRGFSGGNPSGSQELQYEDQGVPLSLWHESRVNSARNEHSFGKHCILQDVDNDGDCLGFLDTVSMNNVSTFNIACTHLTPCVIGSPAV